MSWRDRLTPASFRGVQFFIEDDERAGGQLLARHKFPGRNVHYIEPMGLDITVHNITGYVIGADYDLQRDRLIDALDKVGSGTLVISKYPRGREVVVANYHVRQSTADGGMATFTMTFEDAGHRSQPKATRNTRNAIDVATPPALEAVSASFSARFKLDGLPQWVADHAVETVKKAVSYLRGINGLVNAATAPVAELSRELTAFETELDTLIRTPATFAAELQGLIGSIPDINFSQSSTVSSPNSIGATVSGPRQAFSQLTPLFAFGDDLPPIAATTPTRQQQADNQAALVALVRHTAYAVAAQIVTAIDYTSRDDAQALRVAFVDAGDDLLLEAENVDDTVKRELIAVRNAVVRDVNNRGINLPRLVTYTPKATLPVTVVAYRLYGNIDRKQDIIARNNLRHPGFIAAGSALEVLSDGNA